MDMKNYSFKFIVLLVFDDEKECLVNLHFNHYGFSETDALFNIMTCMNLDLVKLHSHYDNIINYQLLGLLEVKNEK